MKKITVNTWLPVFPGFYGTIYEPDENFEIENINSIRSAHGENEITYDDCEWGYSEYFYTVGKQAADFVGDFLKERGFITSCKFQEVNSPREYNFANDSISIDVIINIPAIVGYINKNIEKFSEYIRERYTSRSGFHSFYSPDYMEWIKYIELTLSDEHQAGAILDFVCRSHDEFDEEDMYDAAMQDVMVYAKNYSALVGEE